ncbi:MAG: leucyl aminopeptidase [Bacteroidota bacterium]
MTTHFQQQLPTNTNQIILLPVAQQANSEVENAHWEHIAQLSGLSTAKLQHCFTAKHKEVLVLPAPEADLILLGLGSDLAFGKLLQAFQHLASKHQRALRSNTVLYIELIAQEQLSPVCEAAVNGLWQGSYQIGQHKTANGDPATVYGEDFKLTIVSAEADLNALQAAADRAQIIAKAQTEIMGLVNAPANHKHPQQLADWAVASAKEYGYSAKIWNKDEITAAGMGGLLAVNQGSPEPPVLIVLEYKGEPDANGRLPKIGLVGKGVTFDTGGLSLKPSNNMHYMKSDMGGAAAVLGTMEATARLKLPVHLVAVVPSTDNSVDAQAVKPSDVIGTYSGKTIEIIDTDAEGRLILADGLSYIVREHQPQVVIDLATLTGSSVRTLGYQAAALFSKDDQLAHHLEQAGQQTGERVWRLPLWDEYGDDMKSDIADIKNFSGRPIAGAITAAKFLEFFTDEHPSWAHLDIAGTAFGDTPYAKGKAATGYGIRLLIQFINSILPS